ncbi:MAG: acetylglutamate kinase [Candidatus Omnitrophica bacterium]|nr:acetylglutamate kinase [Candidatus Omnitrophota bacterium]
MDKNQILQGASKYIEKFKDRVFVIKYGGSILDDKEISGSILDDIICLHENQIDVVLVHGGGSAISKLMKARGKEPEFVGGLRVTDEETASIVDEALSSVNAGLVERVISKGVDAVSLVSREKLTIKGRKKDSAPHGDFVGDVASIDAGHIDEAIKNHSISVVSPVGVGEDKKPYNINADLAAAEIAGFLSAEKFIMLTNVKGVMSKKDDDASLISTLKEKEVHKLIDEGIIDSGMIPKVQAGILALDKGVGKVHVISGRIPHSLLEEIFTDKGIGTEIVK